MGLLNKIERALVKKLKPWLAHDHDAAVMITPSSSHLLFQLRNLNLDVAALNESAMTTSSMLLHEVVVEEADLKLALFSSPVVTLVVRGLHIVLKPRSASDPQWTSPKQSSKDQKKGAALSKPDTKDETGPKVTVKQSQGAAATSFLINCLASFVLSSIRLELHDCSIKFVSHSLKPWSYACSASLESFIVEEGSFGEDGIAGGLFQASIQAVRGRWDQKAGTVKKLCIFQQLALNLETVTNQRKNASVDMRNSTLSHNAADQKLTLLGNSGGSERRILLFEVVSMAVKLREIQFLGLEVDVPDVVVGLDAKELDVMLVLVAQVNGAGVHETDKTLDKTLVKTSRSRPGMMQRGLSHNDFNTEVRTEAGGEQEMADSSFEFPAPKSTARMPTETTALAHEPKLVRISAHGLFRLLAWRVWVHTFSEIVGVASQALLVTLLSLRSLPALTKEAWRLAAGMQQPSSGAASQLPFGDNHHGAQEEEETFASVTLENGNSENALFKVVKNHGPTFAIYFSRGSFTLACAAHYEGLKSTASAHADNDRAAKDPEITGVLQPGVHMTLERISLEYGLDHIGSGSRFGVGSWQLDLISILHSQLPHENTLTLQQGRWPWKTSDTLQLLRSRPYRERSKKDNRIKEFQDIEEIPQAAMALEKHFNWQDIAARAWSQHVWKSADGSCLERGGDFATPLEGDASRAFLMAECGAADVNGAEELGGLMTCALSMGCLECFGDSTISYRIRPLLEQLLTTEAPSSNVEIDTPNPASSGPKESEVPYEEMLLKYTNICRHYIGLAVPKSHVELSVVIESSKFIFAATMGQFEDGQQAKITDSDGIPHSSRGSSLVVEIGSLQLLTWPATRKEVLSEMEARVPMKDGAPIGWWDECVDEKLWLIRPRSPSFPADALGSEEAQVANNLYFALEDAGVLLRTDRNSQLIVPVVGPISCVVQSSFCRDDFLSQWGQIKSATISLEGKLAPVTVHLYLEELTIFSKIYEFGNALMEGFSFPKIVDQEQSDGHETSPVEVIRKSASEPTLSESNKTEVVAEESPRILFALVFKLQLEAFQVALADQRDSDDDHNLEGQKTANGHTSLTSGRQSRNEGDGHGGNDGLSYPGQGRTCYFATLPTSLDVSLGDGYESQISIQMNGAHMGVVPKQLQRTDQHQLLDRSLVDGIALDFDLLLQISETGFAVDRSAVHVRGPKLVGEVEPHSSRQRQSEGVTEVDVSLSSLDGTTTPNGDDLSSTAVRPSNGRSSAPASSGNQLQPNGVKEETAMPGLQQIDQPRWLVVTVDIGSISVTDSLGEALVDRVLLVASGGSTLHIDLGLDKNLKNVTMNVEGGLAIIQTTALHSLVDYVNVHMKLLKGATSASRPSSRELRDVFLLQRSNNADGPSPLLKTTARSVSLPPWALTRNNTKMRRMLSAPRRLQAATEVMLEITPKKGYDNFVSATLGGLSLVLVQRGSTSAAPVEGFLMEVDAKGKAEVKHGSMSRASMAVTRASILGFQGRTFSGVGGSGTRNSSRTPQFRHNLFGSGSGDVSRVMHKSEHTHHSTPSSSGMSDDNNDEQEANDASFLEDGSWKPVDESHSYILERLSFTFAMEKVQFDMHPDFWKWRNAWKGSCSVVGFDFAITTSEVQLLLAVTAPLSGLSSSSSTVEPPPKEYTRSQASEFKTEAPDTQPYLPDGAVIALKDMNEHYYLAVEDKGGNTAAFRLVGVLHYSLVGDRALFKVKYQRNKNGKTVWFSLLSLHAKDSNGKSYRVHYLPGSGLAEVATVHDDSWELWQCIESLEPKSEGNEELDVQTSQHAFHLVNQKSKCGLALVEGSPMLVKRPGNPFKVCILAQQDEPEDVKLVSLENAAEEEAERDRNHDSDQHLREQAVAATVIPNVTCDIQDFTFTLLHEASGGMQLLPLLRLCMQDMGAVLQIGSGKTRVLFGCSVSLDYFQAQNSCWVAVINPIGTELVYRARSEQNVAGVVSKKTPVALFCRLRKVDIIISELSLDTLLFLIGALELAGPYTLRHSPVLANRCQVENQAGLDLVCRFDHGKVKQDGVVQSWETDAFLIRHTTSRRDLTSAEVASSVDLYLQKPGGGRSSAVQVSLTEPGVIAVRTRLQFGEGRRNIAPGPILVVDVLRQSQGGVSLTVSPMVRIRNATGLFLELQCRRPNQEGDGAVVLLEDGDIIDDSMGSFDALRLEGELRKALTSFNVGNYLLSIRPANGSTSESGRENTSNESSYGWSDDVKGAKAVRVSNLFEKFQYSFKKKLGGRNSDVTFGTVFCPAKRPEKEEDGLHFLIRTMKRQVPVTRSDKELVHGKPPVASWQEQQELLLLPTIRIFNLFTSNISAKLFALAPGRARGKAGSLLQPKNEVSIEAGKTSLMYADLGNLSLVIRHHGSGLTSKQVPIFGRDKNSPDASIEGGGLREMELEVDFGDGAHYGMMNVRQDDDGVLEVVVYTKYALHNNSHVQLLYCVPKQRSSYLWRRGQSNGANLEWPTEEAISALHPGSRMSWFNKSSKVMLKQVLPEAQPSVLDLDLLAGSTEISLKVASSENMDQRVQLGVELQLPALGDTNPTRTVHISPRYIVVNKSVDAICVCQDGFQDDMSAVMVLNPGEKTALHSRVLPDHSDEKKKKEDGQNPLQVPLTVRFRPRGAEWDWSGPVCAAALGSFWVKIRRRGQSGHHKGKGRMLFALAEVQEDSPSLTMSFRRHSADAIPYRIENALQSGTLLYSQKGLSQTEVLEAGASVNYVWDDLGLPHKLVVTIQGTQFCQVINMDKIREWKRFGAARRNKGFSLQLPFLEESKDSDNEDEGPSIGAKFLNIGYEVLADGPTRVVRICVDTDSNRQSGWQSNMRRPKMEAEVKVPLLFFSIVEPRKQRGTSADGKEAGDQVAERRASYAPIVVARATNLLIEALVTEECMLCQVKVERLDVDVKWQGATLAHMVRVHGQEAHKLGQIVLHMACVVAHRGTNPIQIHYASLLLQAVDLNVDEDTLMKLAPFYRTSLAPSTGPSRLIYYERFEIHPIKILASFTPGNPQADYTSAQETLRALLHTVIKVPAVRGFKVELNGVLLSNALLTYRQLALKCAQHYSWYAMRAIYIARGSSLLPPAFASLFDDSAASSLDVFFDPANGSVDVQGLTLGMFNILSKGLRKKGGQGGTSRLLGDVEHTVKAAGSNLLFAIVTEVSDSVLKGAETSGFDGLLSGFRRGILNVAMRPAVLRSAVVHGGSTRRIKMDRNVGMDEVYIEGYLQAMLDTMFRQDYLKVKVTDEEVLLRNLPPNTALMEEIMSAVKKFLIGEGLLVGESSLAAPRPTRRLQGDNERRLGPAMIALCEQLLVVIVVQGLRRQANKVLHLPRGEEEKEAAAEKAVVSTEKKEPQERTLPRMKHAVSNFVISSAVAYLDGRLCRHIPNSLVRRIVSGFLLSFVE